jgi:hypothetical protein
VSERWVLIEGEDTLPPRGRIVLAFYENELGNPRIVRAEYVRKHSITDDEGDWGSHADVDESTQKHYWPEGWYEMPDRVESAERIQNVTHWMSMPPYPEGMRDD